jgi:hypothetical protein
MSRVEDRIEPGVERYSRKDEHESMSDKGSRRFGKAKWTTKKFGE